MKIYQIKFKLASIWVKIRGDEDKVPFLTTLARMSSWWVRLGSSSVRTQILSCRDFTLRVQIGIFSSSIGRRFTIGERKMLEVIHKFVCDYLVRDFIKLCEWHHQFIWNWILQEANICLFMWIENAKQGCEKSLLSLQQKRISISIHPWSL